MKPKRIFIDGMNAAHRMRHSLDGLTTAQGVPTGVAYGFLEMLRTLYKNNAPDEIIVAWDSPITGSWRKIFYPQYKQSRQTARDKYSHDEQFAYEQFQKVQLPTVRRMLTGLGIPQVAIVGLEADDIIGLMSKWALLKTDCTVSVVTSDRDFVQLVSANRLTVVNPITEVMFSQHPKTKAVIQSNSTEDTAPTPTIYLWRKAAIGDTSDDIIGVRGVGEKRAVELINDAERPGETWHQYAQRHAAHWNQSAAGRALLDNVSVVFRNLILMDLTGMYARPGIAKAIVGGYKTALRDTAVAYNNDINRITKAVTLPVFLSGSVSQDPSPMLNFFRKLEFQFAYSPTMSRDIKRMFRTLWDTRVKARENDRFLGGRY